MCISRSLGGELKKKKKEICMLETGFEQMYDINKQPHSHDFSALILPSGLAIKELANYSNLPELCAVEFCAEEEGGFLPAFSSKIVLQYNVFLSKYNTYLTKLATRPPLRIRCLPATS